MICGSCGMRMDGRAVLACKERMQPIVEAGHVPVISAMGNLPIVKDLVVDMEPFWQKMRAMKPWLQPGYRSRRRRRSSSSRRSEMNVIHKEALCINCGCCVSECNSMESDPEFLGPAALAKGMRFVGDVARPGDRRAARGLQLRARDLGLHALLLLHTSAARRASTRATRSRSSAPSRSSTASTATWARSTRSGSSPPRRRPAGCARPSSSRRRRASSRRSRRSKFAMSLAKKGKVPLPFPPHVADGRQGVARALQPRQGAGPRRRRRHRAGRARARTHRVRGETTESKRTGPEDKSMKVAYYKGCLASLSAKELDISTQALAPKLGHRARGARVGHVLRRRRHPRGRARLLPAPERADPRLRARRPARTR